MRKENKSEEEEMTRDRKINSTYGIKDGPGRSTCIKLMSRLEEASS